jgi:hypothetical protein
MGENVSIYKTESINFFIQKIYFQIVFFIFYIFFYKFVLLYFDLINYFAKLYETSHFFRFHHFCTNVYRISLNFVIVQMSSVCNSIRALNRSLLMLNLVVLTL